MLSSPLNGLMDLIRLFFFQFASELRSTGSDESGS